MLNDKMRQEYERWCENALEDPDLKAELKGLNDDGIEDAFYRDLEFGTGGLRGVIGAGTNRMNVYTVAKASQGLANYVNKNFKNEALRFPMTAVTNRFFSQGLHQQYLLQMDFMFISISS